MLPMAARGALIGTPWAHGALPVQPVSAALRRRWLSLDLLLTQLHTAQPPSPADTHGLPSGLM
jgi:hypothetical protein